MADVNPTPEACPRSHFPNTVYIIGWEPAGPIKIGHAISPIARLTSLQVSSPYTLRIFACYGFDRGDAAAKVEDACHAAAALHRMSGEWFNLSAVEAKAVVVRECERLGFPPIRWRPSPAQIERRARQLNVDPSLLGVPAPQGKQRRPLDLAQSSRLLRSCVRGR